MTDENCNTLPDSFKESVCIDAGRVFDSCCDRDCLEDLRCYFSAQVQSSIVGASGIKVRSAEVLNVNIDVEPVNFNRGYYSCDLTFFFLVEFDLFSTPHAKPQTISGVAVFSKKVILYGSEGNVKIFSNKSSLEGQADQNLTPTTNMPKCVVQCVDPIALSARIGTACNSADCCALPSYVCECLGGEISTGCQNGTPTVYVTIGLFSIVQLIRNVQMLIPVYDFCIPQKQCNDSLEQPCDVFKKIKFPTSDFFPPQHLDNDNCGCGC